MSLIPETFSHKKHIIVSDIDGTLIGYPDDFNPSLSSFIKENRDTILLIYASGRNLELINDAIESYQLPVPDFYLCSNGVSIHSQDGEDHSKVFQKGFDYFKRDIIIDKLKHLESIWFQEDRFHDIYKVAYYTHQHQLQQTKSDIQLILSNNSFPYSVVAVPPFYIDVMPEGLSKYHALKWLLEQIDLNNHRNVMVAGDNENDRALFCAGYKGIIVGNAVDSIRELANGQNYLSEFESSKGVYDGLKYWGLIG